MQRRTFLKQLMFFPFSMWGLPTHKPKAASRKILINQFSIAGFQYYEGPNILPVLEPGMSVHLIPQPNNPEDEFAVAIFWKKYQLGYVPRSDNKAISRLLQNNVHLVAEILEVNPAAPPWHQVKIKVMLVEKGKEAR